MGTLVPSWSSLFLVPEAAAPDEDAARTDPQGEWTLIDTASDAGAAHTLWANGTGSLCWHVDSGGGACTTGTVDGVRGGKLKTTGVPGEGADMDAPRSQIVLLAWSDTSAGVWCRPKDSAKAGVQKLERLDVTTDSQSSAWIKDMAATEGAVWCDVHDLQRPDGTWQRALLAVSDNRVFLRVEGAVQTAARSGFFSWLAWSNTARKESVTFELLEYPTSARATVRWLDSTRVCVFSGQAGSVKIYRLPTEVSTPQTQTHALVHDTAAWNAIFGGLSNFKVLLDAAPLAAPGLCRIVYGTAPSVRHGRERARPEADVAVDDDYACDAWAILDVSLDDLRATLVREATLPFRAFGGPVGEPSASRVAGGALAVGPDGRATESLDFTVVAFTGTFTRASEDALDLTGRRVTRSMKAKALEARQNLPVGRVWVSYFYAGATQTGARGDKRSARDDEDDGGAAGDRMQEDGEMLARGSKSVRVLEEFSGTEYVRPNVRHLARELTGLEYPRFGWTVRGIVLPGAAHSVAPTRLHAVHGDSFMPRTPLEVVLSCGYTNGSLLNPMEDGHPVRLARSWLTEGYIEIGGLNSVRRLFAPSLTRSGGAACIVGTAPTGKELFAFGNGQFAYTCIDNTLYVLRVSGSSVSDPQSLQENGHDMQFPEAGAVCCGVALLTPHGSANRREPATCDVPDAPSSAPLFESPDDWLVWVFVTARGTLVYRRLCCVDGALCFKEEWKEVKSLQDYVSVRVPPQVAATPGGLGILTEAHYLFLPFVNGAVDSTVTKSGFRAAKLAAPSASLGVGAHSLCVEFGDNGPVIVHNGSFGKSHTVKRQTPVVRVLAVSANGVRVIAVCVDTSNQLVLVAYGLYGDQYVEEDCHIVPFDLIKTAGDKLPNTLACICGVWTSLWVTDTGTLTFETGNQASCMWTRWGGSSAGATPPMFDSFVPHPRLVDPWWSWERVRDSDFFCTLGVRTAVELEWLAEAGGLPVGFCGVLREDPTACAGVLLLPDDAGDIILDAEYGVLVRLDKPKTGDPLVDSIQAMVGTCSSVLMFVPTVAIVGGLLVVVVVAQILDELFTKDQTKQLHFWRRTVPGVAQSISWVLLAASVNTTTKGVPLEVLKDPALAAVAESVLLGNDSLKYMTAGLVSWWSNTAFLQTATSLGDYKVVNLAAKLFTTALLYNRAWQLTEVACRYASTPAWLASTYRRLGISPASLAVAQSRTLIGRTTQTTIGTWEWLRRPTASGAQTYTGLLSPKVARYPRPSYTNAADFAKPWVLGPVRWASGTHFSRFEIATFTHWSRDSSRLLRDQTSASGRLAPSASLIKLESFPGNAAKGGPEVMHRALAPDDPLRQNNEDVSIVSRAVAFSTETLPLSTNDVDLLDLLNVDNDAPWTGKNVRALVVGPYAFVAGARQTENGDVYGVGVLRAGAVAINGTAECGWYYHQGTAVVAQWLLTDCPCTAGAFALTTFKTVSPHDVFLAFSRWSTPDIPATSTATTDKPLGEWAVVALYLVSVTAPNSATLTSLRPTVALSGASGFQYLVAPGTPCAAVLTGGVNCAPGEIGVRLCSWGVNSLVTVHRKSTNSADPKRPLVQVIEHEPYQSPARPPLLSLSAVWEPAYALSDAPDACGLALRLQRLHGTDDVLSSKPLVRRALTQAGLLERDSVWTGLKVTGGEIAGYVIYHTAEAMLPRWLVATVLSIPVAYGVRKGLSYGYSVWKKSSDEKKRAAKRQRTQEEKEAEKFEWDVTVLGVSQVACAERRQIVLQRNVGSDGRRVYMFREYDVISEEFVQDFEPDDSLYDALVELDDAPTLNRRLHYVIVHRHWAVCLMVYDAQTCRASLFNVYLDARAKFGVSPARLLVRGVVPHERAAVPLSLDIGDQYSTLTYWPRTGAETASPERAVLALLPWTYPDFARFNNNQVRYVQLAAAHGVILGTHANDVSDEVRAVVRIPDANGTARLMLRVWSTRVMEQGAFFEPDAARDRFVVRESLANTVVSALPRFTINGLPCNRAEAHTAVVPVGRTPPTADIPQASATQVAKTIQTNTENEANGAAKTIAGLKKAFVAPTKKVATTADTLKTSYNKLSASMDHVDQVLAFASHKKPTNHWAVTARTTIATLRETLAAQLARSKVSSDEAAALNAAAQAAATAEELNTKKQQLDAVVGAFNEAVALFNTAVDGFQKLKATSDLTKATQTHLKKLKTECGAYAKKVQDVFDHVQKAVNDFGPESELIKGRLQTALNQPKTRRNAQEIVNNFDRIQKVLTDAAQQCKSLLTESNDLNGRAQNAEEWTSVYDLKEKLEPLFNDAKQQKENCAQAEREYETLKKHQLVTNAAAKEAKDRAEAETKANAEREAEKQKIVETINNTHKQVVSILDKMKTEVHTLDAAVRPARDGLEKSLQQASTAGDARKLQTSLNKCVADMREHATAYGLLKGELYQTIVGPSSNLTDLADAKRIAALLPHLVARLEAEKGKYDKAHTECNSCKKLVTDLEAKAKTALDAEKRTQKEAANVVKQSEKAANTIRKNCTNIHDRAIEFVKLHNAMLSKVDEYEKGLAPLTTHELLGKRSKDLLQSFQELRAILQAKLEQITAADVFAKSVINGTYELPEDKRSDDLNRSAEFLKDAQLAVTNAKEQNANLQEYERVYRTVTKFFQTLEQVKTIGNKKKTAADEMLLAQGYHNEAIKRLVDVMNGVAPTPTSIQKRVKRAAVSTSIRFEKADRAWQAIISELEAAQNFLDQKKGLLGIADVPRNEEGDLGGGSVPERRAPVEEPNATRDADNNRGIEPPPSAGSAAMGGSFAAPEPSLLQKMTDPSVPALEDWY